MKEFLEKIKQKQNLTFVVDRFYSSTCAYTVGKATTGSVEELEDLLQKNQSLTSWPEDLLLPSLSIILTIGSYFFILYFITMKIF